tara:strand:+ start:344 stop:523 length:180 start_codon:yes stop_codon:yes gene_type:complete
MSEVVWGVNILLAILLATVTWYIYYILRMAYAEMNDGSDDTTKQEELLQLSSDRDSEST